MSHKHPASDRGRVSPRRRFHRPAAEFLGARRQVPVLTGLPRIGEESGNPSADMGTTETPCEIVEPVDALEQVVGAQVEHVEENAEQPDEMSAESPDVDLFQAGPVTRAVAENWHEWVYPVTGTLVATLLVYTALVGVTGPSPQNSNRDQLVDESLRGPETDTQVHVAQVAPPRVPAFDPSEFNAADLDGLTLNAQALESPLVGNAPAVAPAIQSEVGQMVEGGGGSALPSVVQAPPEQRAAAKAEREPFIQRPIQAATDTTKFVEHDVTDWPTPPTTALVGPTTSVEPSFDGQLNGPAHESNTEESFDDAFASYSPTAPNASAMDLTSAHPSIAEAVTDNQDEDFSDDGVLSMANSETPLDTIEAQNENGIVLSSQSTVHELSSANGAYPRTDFADELPKPNVHFDNGFTIPTTTTVNAAPSQNPLDAGGPQVARHPPMATAPFSGLPQPGAGPGSLSSAAYAVNPSPHVIANPHFQPTLQANRAADGPAFETARAPSPSHHHALRSGAAMQQSRPNKSIYGTFPVNGSPNATEFQPSVEHARLNGNIEPFPQ